MVMKGIDLCGLAVAFTACVSFGGVEGLMPPTADQDPALSRERIRVAGVERWIHIQTFGEANAPPLLVLHGSLGDHRALLPLRALADRYRVVFWDQRGNGLSERIPEKEYTEASIVEEIDAVADRVAPAEPVTLIGHSFGAMFTSLYMSSRPSRIKQAVLIEPGGLNGAIFEETFSDIIDISLFDPKMNAMFWQTEQVGAIDHDSADYRALMILLNGRQTRYHCDRDRPPPWPVWRPGAAAEVYRAGLLGSSGLSGRFHFDFARNVRAFQGEVLFLAGSCSALGPQYQSRWHAPLFEKASVVTIPNTGHRLIQESPEAVLTALRGYLERYSPATP